LLLKQSIWLNGISTNDALFLLNQFIHDKLDNDSNVLGLFLDVKRAFDGVNHKILLKKFYYCGSRGKMYDLLKSYLSKRTQIVKLKNSVSTSLQPGPAQAKIVH